MLQNILKLKEAKELNKKEQTVINGGGSFPTNEESCLNCGGEWYAPFCQLPSNSICLQH